MCFLYIKCWIIHVKSDDGLGRDCIIKTKLNFLLLLFPANLNVFFSLYFEYFNLTQYGLSSLLIHLEKRWHLNMGNHKQCIGNFHIQPPGVFRDHWDHQRCVTSEDSNSPLVHH